MCEEKIIKKSTIVFNDHYSYYNRQRRRRRKIIMRKVLSIILITCIAATITHLVDGIFMEKQPTLAVNKVGILSEMNSNKEELFKTKISMPVKDPEPAAIPSVVIAGETVEVNRGGYIDRSNIDGKNTNFNNFTEEDYEYLLKIIVGECQCGSWEEQIYTGSVVINRMFHPDFKDQDTIKQVALRQGQYACFKDGNAYRKPTDTNIKAAQYLIDNGSQLPDNVVYQARFKQGSGVYCEINGTYFCYK